MILRPNEPIKSIIENKQYIKMNKKLIRLTESDLHKVIKESVNRVLNEISIDTLQRAQDKAFKDFDSMLWLDDEDYDEDLDNKR